MSWYDADGDGFGRTIIFEAHTNLSLLDERHIGINYSWDWTSDGIYENTTTHRNNSYEYPTPDPYIVTLKVTDLRGNIIILRDWVQASVYPENRPWLSDGNDPRWSGILASKNNLLPDEPNTYIEFTPIPDRANPNARNYSYIMYREKSSEHLTLSYEKLQALRNVPYASFMHALGLDTYTIGISINITWYNPVEKRNEIIRYGLSPEADGIGSSMTKNIVIIKKPRFVSSTTVLHPQRFEGTLTLKVIQWGVSRTESLPDKPTVWSPMDSATGLTPGYITLKINVSHPDGKPMKVTFYNALNNTEICHLDNVKNVSPATFISVILDGNNNNPNGPIVLEGTTYSWYVIVDDGTFIQTSDTWTFTTMIPQGGQPV
jgi:hypothetical protein